MKKYVAISIAVPAYWLFDPDQYLILDGSKTAQAQVAQRDSLSGRMSLGLQRPFGLGKTLATIHTYPTRAEANKHVTGEWRRAQATKRLLFLMEKYNSWKRR